MPDGGTVLLGGIKRLSEGRNERGVPMLSKIPYINRLFKNVGIGRETQSLMMMVISASADCGGPAGSPIKRNRREPIRISRPGRSRALANLTKVPLVLFKSRRCQA